MSMRIFILLFFSSLCDALAADDAAECDLDNGEAVFQKCAVCHSIEAGVPHGAGPNLHDLAGRAVGKVEGFKFSKRMRESQTAWDEAHLDAFLTDPAALYKRTRMAFGGIKDPLDRRDLICYLNHEP